MPARDKTIVLKLDVTPLLEREGITHQSLGPTHQDRT